MSKYDPDKDGFQTHLLSYPYQGGQWGFELRATSQEDAEARIAAMHNYGQYDGILMGEIPAGIPGAGLWVRFICWWRTLRSRSA